MKEYCTPSLDFRNISSFTEDNGLVHITTNNETYHFTLHQFMRILLQELSTKRDKINERLDELSIKNKELEERVEKLEDENRKVKDILNKLIERLRE